MLSLERFPTFRQHPLRLCAKYGFSPRVVQEAHELPTLFALARAGVGIAVVPISASGHRPERNVSYQLSSRNESCSPRCTRSSIIFTNW
jgi:DNA-binding transcriptional LysR family regulator